MSLLFFLLSVSFLVLMAVFSGRAALFSLAHKVIRHEARSWFWLQKTCLFLIALDFVLVVLQALLGRVS